MKSIFNFAKQHQQKFKVITIVVPIIIGAFGLILTATEVWMSGSSDGNLPQIRSNTVSDLQTELKKRQSQLQSEIESIENLLADIERTKSVAKGVSVEKLERSKDFFLITGIKTLAIYFLVFLTAVISVFILIVDLIALMFGYNFPVLRAVWEFVWNTATIEWYWDRADTVGTVIGLFIILLTAIPGMIQEHHRKKKVSEDIREDSQPPNKTNSTGAAPPQKKWTQ